MHQITIIGGGPAGLMAADILASPEVAVTIYDHMSSVGRKFLMAGRGGLNLTHSEPLDIFLTRYGKAAEWLEPAINAFPPTALIDWCQGLDQPTFIGTSGRIFPKGLKASPLLRALLRRLDKKGVKFALKRKWMGWDKDNQLLFQTTDQKTETVKADAVLLALGGASWPRLGSDGGWIDILTKSKIAIAPLQPANCGFMVPWTDIFRDKFEGRPLKPVIISFGDQTIQGEAMITAKGIEGGLIYALSTQIREALNAKGSATLNLDLRPGISAAELTSKLEARRDSQSLSNNLRKLAGLSPVAIGLLYETKQDLRNLTNQGLAELIKACPLKLTAPYSIERAISTAGGISRDAVDNHFMLRNKPGVFVAGEMLDWEAPTGGYLLQATFSTAVVAANGIKDLLKEERFTRATRLRS